MKNLAVIPARGGSKRVPDKNILEFCGKPMIVHTLEAAKNSGLFSKIVVSTEDVRIKEIVTSFNYEILDRPEELATDTANLVPVILHAIDTLNNEEKYQNVCVLMANCPIRDFNDVRKSGNSFENNSSNFMMSVFKYGMFYPFWALAESDKGLKPYFGRKYFKTRSQDLPQVYCPSGAIRWVDVKAFKKYKNFYGPDLKPYVLPWYKAIDIDENEDLIIANIVMQLLHKNPELFHG
jgi:CMP-N-acetylneuraminic acid synthetase